MIINKKIFALLAIFLMIASISVISAADDDVTPSDDDKLDEDNLGGDTGNDTEDETGDDDATGDEDIDVGDNPYRHGALTPNEKAFLEDGNAAGENSHSVSASGSPTTGNPILVLLAAMAILGAYPLSRKK